jgi:hypothetical protein
MILLPKDSVISQTLEAVPSTETICHTGVVTLEKTLPDFVRRDGWAVENRCEMFHFRNK